MDCATPKSQLLHRIHASAPGMQQQVLALRPRSPRARRFLAVQQQSSLKSMGSPRAYRGQATPSNLPFRAGNGPRPAPSRRSSLHPAAALLRFPESHLFQTACVSLLCSYPHFVLFALPRTSSTVLPNSPSVSLVLKRSPSCTCDADRITAPFSLITSAYPRSSTARGDSDLNRASSPSVSAEALRSVRSIDRSIRVSLVPIRSRARASICLG